MTPLARPAARTLSVAALAVLVLLLPAPGARAEQGWAWPVEGTLLSAYRNGDDPYAGGQHRGIDIAASAGAGVVAATAGTVTFAGVAGDSGLTVAIRAADGRFDTSYLHLGEVAVRRGDRVSAGDPIGTVGTTGRRSWAEPHLHFGVRAAGERHAYRDPLASLPPPAALEPRTPRAVPVVVPQPVPPVAELAPATPAPALAPLPSLGPAPAALPAPTPVPSLGPAPAPAPASAPLAAAPAPLAAASTPAFGSAAPARRSAPAAGPASRRASSTGSAPSARTRLLGARAPAPVGEAASLGPAPLGPAPRTARGASAPPAPQRTAARPAATPDPSAGVDLGWLAACVGLVAAAMLLGRPRGPVGSWRRARALTAAAPSADVNGIR